MQIAGLQYICIFFYIGLIPQWESTFRTVGRTFLFVLTAVEQDSNRRPMDEWTIKTPNPVCRVFYKIDLLKDFAALYLTDFIDWSGDTFTHGWYFRLWTVAPMDEGTILVFCCPSTFSLTSPPPSQTKCTVSTDSVGLWGGVWCWIVLYTIFCRSFTFFFWQDSESTILLHHPKQKWPVKTTLKYWCLYSSFVQARDLPYGSRRAIYRATPHWW